MKAHRTDLVSFAFGLLFLALSAWWLSAQILGLVLPPVGWFLAGAAILIGVLGLVGALRSGRHADQNAAAAGGPAAGPGQPTAPDEPASGAGWGAAPPVSGGDPGWHPDRPTSGGILPGWEPEPATLGGSRPSWESGSTGGIHPAWQVDRPEATPERTEPVSTPDATVDLAGLRDADTSDLGRVGGTAPGGGDERPTEAITDAPVEAVEDRPTSGPGGGADPWPAASDDEERPRR